MGVSRPVSFQAPSTKAPSATEQSPAKIQGEAATTVEVSSSKTGDLAKDLHEALCNARLNTSADAVQRSQVRLDGNDLVIRGPKSLSLALRDANVQRIAAQVIGRPVRIKIEIGEAIEPALTAVSEDVGTGDSDVRERALSHPGVKRFQELFPGAQVRTVRNLNE
jgi:hypothetical protein